MTNTRRMAVIRSHLIEWLRSSSETWPDPVIDDLIRDLELQAAISPENLSAETRAKLMSYAKRYTEEDPDMVVKQIRQLLVDSDLDDEKTAGKKTDANNSDFYAAYEIVEGTVPPSPDGDGGTLVQEALTRRSPMAERVIDTTRTVKIYIPDETEEYDAVPRNGRRPRPALTFGKYAGWAAAIVVGLLLVFMLFGGRCSLGGKNFGFGSATDSKAEESKTVEKRLTEEERDELLLQIHATSTESNLIITNTLTKPALNNPNKRVARMPASQDQVSTMRSDYKLLVEQYRNDKRKPILVEVKYPSYSNP